MPLKRNSVDAFNPKALNINTSAGLLTYSPFPAPSRNERTLQWQKDCRWANLEFTAAGLSGICTRFPFKAYPLQMGCTPLMAQR